MAVFKFLEDDNGAPLIEDIDTFIHMNIGQEGIKNAVLLSLSILLQNFQEKYALTSVCEAIDTISEDIETDGTFDNSM